MTIKEASAAWGITERRVNALCKAGRISGAYKRAGSGLSRTVLKSRWISVAAEVL